METAAGHLPVVDAKMADLVRRMSLLRGLDPRASPAPLSAAAGPLHSPRRGARRRASDA